MKIFAAIFAFYILALNAVPCVDVHSAVIIHKAEISQGTCNDHHNDFDACSPFCTCDCCTSRVFEQQNDIRFDLSPIGKEYFVIYKSSYLSLLPVNIWRPPKIS